MKSSIWPKLTLAIAAAVSLATSQVQEEYVVVDDQPLPATELGAQTPIRHFRITSEVRGEKSIPDPFITVHLVGQARTVPVVTTELRVTLQSQILTGYVTSELVTVSNIDGTAEAYIDLLDWTSCISASCPLDELDLAIELVQPLDAAPIDLTGTVELQARGAHGEAAPTGTITGVSLLP